MCLRLRKTARRGRAGSPSTRRRIRSWRLTRAAPRLAIVVIGRWSSAARGLLLAADLAGLAGLAADLLAGVANALALVRLGLAARPDARRDLADQLLVDADDGQLGRVLDLEADAGRRIDLDGMAVAEAQLELPADEDGAVADARDLEALAVPRGHADDHVVDEGPGQPVELLVGLRLARPGHEDRIALAADGHLGMEVARERALRAGHGDVATLDGEVDPGRDGDGQATDSGHPATRRRPG